MSNFWDQHMPTKNPLEEAMRLMEMVLSNADRVSWNPEHKWDPESTYETAYGERGTPEGLRGLLAGYSRLMEPDLLGIAGDLMSGARAVGTAADVATAARTVDEPVYQIVRGADGQPVRMYRIEGSGGGRGPIAADMNYPQGTARYYGDDQYVRGFAGWRDGSYLAREGYPMARAGGVLDTTGELGIDSADLIRRMRESAIAGAPAEHAEFVARAFDNYAAGTSSALDLTNDLRRVFGHDMGRIPQESGLDVLVQLADDGRGIGREVVTFGGDRTWKDLNVYTPEELLNLIPRGGAR